MRFRHFALVAALSFVSWLAKNILAIKNILKMVSRYELFALQHAGDPEPGSGCGLPGCWQTGGLQRIPHTGGLRLSRPLW